MSSPTSTSSPSDTKAKGSRSQKPTFFDLPGEIRNKIYAFSFSHSPPRPHARLGLTTLKQPSLTLVNKRIQFEALRVFFAHSSFAVSFLDIAALPTISDSTAAWVRRVGREATAHIRDLRVTCGFKGQYVVFAVVVRAGGEVVVGVATTATEGWMGRHVDNVKVALERWCGRVICEAKKEDENVVGLSVEDVVRMGVFIRSKGFGGRIGALSYKMGRLW